MKKLVLLFILSITAGSLFGHHEPIVKFYMNDRSSKEYKISEIENIGIIDNKNNYVIKIFYLDTLIAYYPTEIIGKVKFELDTLNNKIMNIYIFDYPKSYLLNTIDSIIFYIDKYQPLTIATQVWMLKNLDVDNYMNGNSIPEVRDSAEWSYLKTGAWCYFNNDTALGAIYGKLYNWYAVNDSRSLAPTGWHVPSDAEWTTLTNFLGFDSVAGGKLKEIGTTHWGFPNTGATNESGFSALPGGTRDYGGEFCFKGGGGNWWSSTESGAAHAWLRFLYYYRSNIGRSYDYKYYGYSVRCIKD